MTPRITIAGEIYSTNLGDGLIYESLGYLFRRQEPSATIQALDISGRSHWQTASKPPLKTKFTALGRLITPKLYRWINVLQFGIQYLTQLEECWKRILAQTDLLVIGGGQLLMDNYLDFPFKLLLLFRLANQLGIPIHIVGVGVGGNWSRTGKSWAEKVVHSALSISVRDFVSQDNLRQIFQRPDVSRTADAAFWAEEVYGRIPNPQEQKIGLGVLNFADFKAHDISTRLVTARQWLAYWQKIVAETGGKGLPVEIFTNGNLLDEEFAWKVYRGHSSGMQQLRKAERPTLPRALAHRISGYRAVIAARYHANILAAVYRVPALGFIWDNKVRYLYQSIGCEDQMIDYWMCSAADVAGKLSQQFDPPPLSVIERNKELVVRDIARVLTY